MKVTDAFTEIIQSELSRRATNDNLFAASLKKPDKSIKGCVNYIISQVQKSGRMGFADDEIFNMASHYYDEDNIKDPGTPKNLQKIVVNQSIGTPVARNESPKPKKKMQVISNQQTLF